MEVPTSRIAAAGYAALREHAAAKGLIFGATAYTAALTSAATV